MKALSRSAACALGVRALLVLPASPLFPLPASGFQADDKSFSLAVPPAWQLDPAPPRVAQPDSVLFRVVGSDAAGGRFEATVEPSPKKQLGELGSLDAVAQRYLALQPQPAALLGATTVPRPNMFGLQMYELRFSTGAQRSSGWCGSRSRRAGSINSSSRSPPSRRPSWRRKPRRSSRRSRLTRSTSAVCAVRMRARSFPACVTKREREKEPAASLSYHTYGRLPFLRNRSQASDGGENERTHRHSSRESTSIIVTHQSPGESLAPVSQCSIPLEKELPTKRHRIYTSIE